MTKEERKEYLEDLTKEAIGEFRSFRVFNEENLREWLNEDEVDEDEKLTEKEYNDLFDEIEYWLNNRFNNDIEKMIEEDWGRAEEYGDYSEYVWGVA